MKKIRIGAFLLLLLPVFAHAQILVKDTTLYFDFDKYEIRKEYSPILSSLVSELKKDTTLTVEISGHTDSLGKSAYNDKLSMKRTETVIKFFHKESVHGGGIKAYHYGSTHPVASNQTAEGRKKNRRVEIKIFKKEVVKAVPAVAETKPERIEIDVHYNKENFAYIDNHNRSIVHTVGQAELIMQPETFVLPERSALYKNDKVRLDFIEISEKGSMVLNAVASGKKGGVLDFSYVFCLDSITNNGHAHIAKGTTIEFLIPSKYHVEGAAMYYSPDHDRQNWTVLQKPKFNSFHNCYEVLVKDEGCVALANKVEADSPVTLQVKYSGKIKGTNFTEKPEFYFLLKDKNIILTADSTTESEAFFKGLEEGNEGTIVALVRSDPNNAFISVEDVRIKGGHNGQTHAHGTLKFKRVNHFELEKTLKDLHKPSF